MSASPDTQKRTAAEAVGPVGPNERLLPHPRKLRKLNRRIASILSLERAESPLQTLSSTEEPLAQEDVLYFQKEALCRLLQLQHRKNALLASALDTVHRRYSRVLLCNSLLVQWWSQIRDTVKALYRGGEDSVGDSDGVADGDAVATHNHLLSLVAADSTVDDKDELLASVKADLDALHTSLSAVLAPLVGKTPLTPSTEQLLALETDVAAAKALQSALAAENAALRDQLATTKTALEDVHRRHARESSKSVQRVRSIEVVAEKDSAKESKSECNKEKTTDSTHSPADRASLEHLEVQLEELRGRNESLLSQVEEKSKKVTELERNLATVSTKNATDLAKYNDTLDELEKLRAQLNDALAVKKKLESELFEIESKVTQNQANLEDKVRSEIESNQSYVEKLEKDLTRIRSDRDALSAKISVLRTEKGDKNTILDDFKVLTKTMETRVQELENVEQKLLNNSTDERENILVEELKQVEAAFRDIREIAAHKLISAHEFEQQMSKLSAEKAKAEEKYFQAMRTKDALTSQNKVLQTSIAKQIELIDVLRKKEIELVNKLNIEGKLYNLLLKIENVNITDLENLKNKLSKSDKELVFLKEQEKDLRGEISRKDYNLNSFEKLNLSLQRDVSSLQKSIEYLKNRYNSNNSSNDNNDVQEALLSMTKCSLCNKNFKNVTLKTCGHCFCNDCVNDRLSSRMRKCPNCNSQFSQYDVLNIHL